MKGSADCWRLSTGVALRERHELLELGLDGEQLLDVDRELVLVLLDEAGDVVRHLARVEVERLSD